jgi:hypothetical protein
LQEVFAEKLLRDVGPNYDFMSVRAGNQSFNSDFRGLIFNDTNFGVRLFGNRDSNRWQYNFAAFDLREKNAYSDLNTLERRGQIVAIANVYRQDFLRPGYTAQLSFHASLDDGNVERDDKGADVRPAPLPGARRHRVSSFYLGWCGDGHLGRWNVSHAAYTVFGRDEFNALAGRSVGILAHLAAVEVSRDWDWVRWKFSAVFASGDHDARDGRASGFDAIVENANFVGGPFSYYTRQGMELGGSRVGLKQRFSLFPTLRAARFSGQQSFVNPGVSLLGSGFDLALTPRLRATVQANHLRFATTAPLEALLATRGLDRTLGNELGLGVQWRPLLTENIVVSAGGGALRPGAGYRAMYSVTGYKRLLHSALVAVALTY